MERAAKHFRKRDAILTCLRQTTEHPSAEWVYNRLKPEYPDLSLGTVYRNLTLFKEQGVISSLGTVKGVERFDGNTAPHVHFVCTGCASVIDLPEIQIPASLRMGEEKAAGCHVSNCQLTFTGICNQCNENKMEESI